MSKWQLFSKDNLPETGRWILRRYFTSSGWFYYAAYIGPTTRDWERIYDNEQYQWQYIDE